MNPFLTGLIERATLGAPALERRPRSLFEPVAVTSGGTIAAQAVAPMPADELDGPTDPTEPDDPSRARRPELAVGADPVARAPRLENPAEPAQPDRGVPAASSFSAARQAGDEPRLASASVSPPGDLEPGARLDVHRDEIESVIRPVPRRGAPPATTLPVQPVLPERRILPMPPLAFAQPDRARPAASVPRDSSRARTAPPAEAARPTVALAPSASGESPASTDARLLDPATNLSGEPPSIVRPLAIPHAPRHAPWHAPRHASPPNGVAAPSPAPVHVTIGRIEVRASAPAAERPPVRRSPTGPRMSLDDYLNGRKGSR